MGVKKILINMSGDAARTGSFKEIEVIIKINNKAGGACNKNKP